MFGVSSALLTKKTVIVTGAGKGIGKACALMAAKCGAHVIAVARTESDLQALKTQFPDNIEAWVDDVTSDSFIAKVKSLPALHGLINNVGTNKVAKMMEQDDEDLDTVIDLNLKS